MTSIGRVSPGSWSLNTAVTQALEGFFGGRLERTAATTLELQRYSGAQVEVNGELVPIAAGGIELATTDNLIAADGTDSTLPVQASTLYYVYLSNGSASYRPTDLGLSATSPSDFNGFKYLATTGNGANWRFCGWIYTNSSTQFVDNASKRLVVNYYNRQQRHARSFPGYADDNATTTITYNGVGTSYELLHADAVVEWIANGEDSFLLTGFINFSSTTSADPRFGISVNSTTDPEVACAPNPAGAKDIATLLWSEKASEGYTVGRLLGRDNATNWSYLSDLARNGSTFDPRSTGIVALVSV